MRLILQHTEGVRRYISNNWEVITALTLTIIPLGFLAVFMFQPVEPFTINGYLLGKEYEPASSSVGIGSGVNSDGKPITVVTNSSKAETWTLIVQVKDKVFSYSVSADTYYSVELDTHISLYCVRGKWVHLVDCR
jgi:hypothetical protein